MKMIKNILHSCILYFIVYCKDFKKIKHNSQQICHFLKMYWKHSYINHFIKNKFINRLLFFSFIVVSFLLVSFSFFSLDTNVCICVKICCLEFTCQQYLCCCMFIKLCFDTQVYLILTYVLCIYWINILIKAWCNWNR